MNVSDLLNPLPTRTRCISSPTIISTPYSKEQEQHMIGKPRSRFSEYEDNIIRQGVANRLTWGQISDLLPHRKRATCFNRYRTLQGIRKSRKSSTSPVSSYYSSPPTMYHHDILFYHNTNDISSDSSSDENDDYIKHTTTTTTTTTKIPLPPPLYHPNFM